MKRKTVFTILTILSLSIAACSGKKNQPQQEQKPVNLEGLEITDIKTGEGMDVTRDMKIVVHYTGWLENGTKFDSSRDRGNPFIFTLGIGEVIPGWDYGIQGMKPGGIRKLVIPPQLAYGDREVGRGLIPKNSTLIFEVELLKILY